MPAHRITLDTTTKTSALELFVGGAYVTSYSYAPGAVTLSERASVTVVPLAEWVEIVDQIATWSRLLRSKLVPSVGKRAKFHDELTKKNAAIVGSFKFEGVLIADVEYKNGPKELTFQPRPQVVMSYSDFLGWFDFLDRLAVAASGF